MLTNIERSLYPPGPWDPLRHLLWMLFFEPDALALAEAAGYCGA